MTKWERIKRFFKKKPEQKTISTASMQTIVESPLHKNYRTQIHFKELGMGWRNSKDDDISKINKAYDSFTEASEGILNSMFYSDDAKTFQKEKPKPKRITLRELLKDDK